MAEMRKIMLDRSFEAKGLSWKSFATHTGHLDAEGCFRCHDGKHMNEKGESIRLQCTLCHDLPKVTLENGKGTVPSTVAAGLTPPSSHEEPNFMHEHRFKVDESCTMCHGKLEFGREGGNFCANPACHGRQVAGRQPERRSQGGRAGPGGGPRGRGDEDVGARQARKGQGREEVAGRAPSNGRPRAAVSFARAGFARGDKLDRSIAWRCPDEPRRSRPLRRSPLGRGPAAAADRLRARAREVARVRRELGGARAPARR